MSWWVWVLLAVVAVWLLGSGDSKKTGSKKKTKKAADRTEADVSSEAQEIADKVTTIQQFRALDRRMERAAENLSDRYEVLQEAVYIASEKTYQWQFMPSVDLDTPKHILERAYKVFSIEEYKDLSGQLSDKPYDWNEIDGYGEVEDLEPEIKPLIKFRTIVESREFSREEKIKKINQLVSRNEVLADIYFDDDEYLKPGDQWYAAKLASAGLPLAYDLYSEGYDTPEKCLEIDIGEFSTRKGVGPKKREQLENFLAKVRREMHTRSSPSDTEFMTGIQNLETPVGRNIRQTNSITERSKERGLPPVHRR